VFADLPVGIVLAKLCSARSNAIDYADATPSAYGVRRNDVTGGFHDDGRYHQGFHADIQSRRHVQSNERCCLLSALRPTPRRFYITLPMKRALFAYIDCVLSYNPIRDFITQ